MALTLMSSNIIYMSVGEQKVEAKIKASDMDAEEIERVKELLSQGLRESLKDQKQERVLSRYLKTEMDKNGSGWNCVVGKNFGAHVIHQTKKYIFL
jgi:dynein light chain LC8-type